MTGVHGVKAEASVIQGKPVKNQPRKHSIRYQPSPSATPFRHACSPPQGMGQRGEQASVQADIRAHEQRAGVRRAPTAVPEVVNRDGQPVEAGQAPARPQSQPSRKACFQLVEPVPSRNREAGYRSAAAGKDATGLGIPIQSPAAPQKIHQSIFMRKTSRKRLQKSSEKDERGCPEKAIVPRCFKRCDLQMFPTTCENIP